MTSHGRSITGQTEAHNRHTKRTDLEVETRREVYESKLVELCNQIHERTVENMQDILALARKVQNRGIEDMQRMVSLIQDHRLDTRRLFGINRLTNLKSARETAMLRAKRREKILEFEKETTKSRS